MLVLAIGVGWYRHGGENGNLIASCQASIINDGSEPGADLEFHGAHVVEYGDGRVVILGVVTGGTPDEHAGETLDGRELARTFECRVDENGDAHWVHLGSLS